MELIIRSDHMEEVAGVSAEYPYALNGADSAQTRIPWHWHEEVEFNYVVRGALKVTVSGREYIYRAGQGCFINSNVLHTMQAEEPQTGAVWFSPMFHPAFLGGQYKSVFDTKYLSPVLKNKSFEIADITGETENQQQMLELLRQVITLRGQPYEEFRTRNVISDLWLLLMGELAALEQRAMLRKPANQERIQTMLSFIHQHYDEKLTLDQIAAAAIVSRRECLRCFRECIQKTPFEYLLDYRIQMAERLLRDPGMTVTQVAMRTGFSSSAYFTKVFRQLRGMPPSQYRK